MYVLINGMHGLNQMDRTMLQHLDEQCQASGGRTFGLQAIITKADGLLAQSSPPTAVYQIQQDIFDVAPTCSPVIVTSALKAPRLGIDEMRSDIAEACGLE